MPWLRTLPGIVARGRSGWRASTAKPSRSCCRLLADTFGLLPGELLVALDDHVAIQGVEFHEVCLAVGLLGREPEGGGRSETKRLSAKIGRRAVGSLRPDRLSPRRDQRQRLRKSLRMLAIKWQRRNPEALEPRGCLRSRLRFQYRANNGVRKSFSRQNRLVRVLIGGRVRTAIVLG
jgi:hypothetical protein